FLYYKIFDAIEQPATTKEESNEILGILRMFESLGDSYDNLSDKEGLSEHEIEFTGFDGNGEEIEVRFKNFVSFHCNVRSTEDTDPTKPIPSNVLFPAVFRRSRHWYQYNVPQLPGYRAMFKKWSAMTRDGSWSAANLSKEDIQQIIACRRTSPNED